jgi:hypothetical protein
MSRIIEFSRLKRLQRINFFIFLQKHQMLDNVKCHSLWWLKAYNVNLGLNSHMWWWSNPLIYMGIDSFYCFRNSRYYVNCKLLRFSLARLVLVRTNRWFLYISFLLVQKKVLRLIFKKKKLIFYWLLIMYDLTRDVLFDIFRCVRISVKKEVHWISWLTHKKEDRHFIQRIFYECDLISRNITCNI